MFKVCKGIPIDAVKQNLEVLIAIPLLRLRSVFHLRECSIVVLDERDVMADAGLSQQSLDLLHRELNTPSFLSIVTDK